ncbi:hypothetical protein CW731_09755 [Polaribacter sp. ALD11]|nr:hypothetical protein CW731_09755 [Polaribacter sp. ALD11]
MKKITPFVPLLFPVLIIFFGLITYKVLEYEPNLYTIIINIGLAFVLSPRLKKVKKQNETETQFRWLFYKKILK